MNPINVAAGNTVGILITGSMGYFGTGTSPISAVTTFPGNFAQLNAGGISNGFGGVVPSLNFNPRGFVGSIVVELDLIGNCVNSFTNVTTDSILATTAQVNWTPGATNSSFWLEYGLTGFTPGTGTMISGTYPGTQPPVNLTGLAVNTNYDYYIGEICNSGADSIYSASPYQFSTTRLCAPPTNLAVSSVLTTSADITWSHAGGANSFTIFYGAGLSQTATSSPFTLTGLSPAASYDIYVQADCGNTNGVSDSLGPINLTTACGIAVAPYSQNFNTGALPNCWSISATSGDGWRFVGNPGYDAANNGRPAGSYAWIDFSGTDQGTIMELIPVDVSSLSTAQIEFDYFCFNTTNPSPTNILYVEAFDGTNWVTVNSIQVNSIPGWNSYNFSLAGYDVAGVVSVRLRGESGGATNDFYNDILVDDLFIREAPSCPRPPASSFGVSNLLATSADLNWLAGGNELFWGVEWGPAGFTLGSGNFNTTNLFFAYPISGLTATTTYEFYIQAICAPGDTSVWSGPFSFTTPCGALIPPQLEDFSRPFPPNVCWDQAGNGNPSIGPSGIGNSLWSSDGFGNVGTTGAVRCNLNITGDNEWILTPQYDFSSGGPFQVEFDFGVFTQNSSNPGTLGSDDRVEVLISRDGGGSWSVLKNFNNNYTTNPNGNHEIVGLPNDSTVVQFAFWASEGTVNDPVSNDVMFDNFEIIPMPACPEPTSLIASAVTANNANISWTPGGSETSWYIEWGVSGFLQGTGTNDSVTTNSYSLTGLSSSTTYDVYIQSFCSTNNLSFWAGPLTFNTPIQGPVGVNCVSGGNPGIIYSDDLETSNGWTGSFGTGTTAGSWNVRTGPTGSTGTGPSGAHSGNNYFYYETSGVNPSNNSITSPLIDLSSGTDEAELSFWIHAYGATMGTLNIGVGNTSTGPFTTIFTNTGQIQTGNNDPYQNVGINLSSYLGQQIYLQLDYTSGTSFTGDIAIDLIEVSSCISCPSPSVLSASNITANSADLSWVAGGTETAWDIQYGNSGFALGSGTTVGVTTNPYSLTGLSASTTYDYYIKAICAPGDSSSWAGPFTFTTAFQCPPNAICAGPFNTGDIPSDRDFVLNGQTSTCPGTLQVVIPAGFVIDSIATMYDFTAQGGAWMSEQRSLLYLPSIGIGEPNAAAGTGGTSAGTESYARTTSFPIGLNVNGTVDIEIHAGRTWGGTGCNTQYNKIDDGTWMVIAYYGVAATCPPPSNLTVSNITANSADLSWTAGGTETAWDIQYGASGFAPGSGTTVGVTTNPYSLTGLSASSTYDYYIKAICAPGDSSSWTGPFTFTTTCLTAVAPYSQNFNNGALPLCWNQSAIGGDGWRFIGTPGYSAGTNGRTAGTYAWIDFSGNDQGTIMEVVPVDVSSLTAALIEFDYFCYHTVNVSPTNFLYIEAFDGTNWVTVNSIQINTLLGWNSYSFSLVGFDVNGVVSVRLRGESGGSTQDFYNDILVDDLFIGEAPSCLKPTNLSTSNVSGTSADFSWTAGGTETAWNIEWGVSGFTLGSGNFISVNTNPYSLTGLSSSTTYDVYIQAVCSPGDSSIWAGPLSFTTPCGALLPPQLEDFTAGFTPNQCWEQAGDGTPLTGPSAFGNSSWFTDGFGNVGTTGAVKINLYTTGKNEWVLTPQYDLSIGGRFQVEFDFGVFDWPTTTPGTLGSDDRVELLISRNNGTTWSNLKSFDNNYTTAPGGNHEIVTLPNDSGVVQFAIWATEGSINDPEDNDVMFDNFEVATISVCPEPSTLSATNITGFSADLSWVAGGTETAWDIQYGPSGFTLGSGTTVGVTTNLYSLTGLSASTTYDYYVKAICAPGDSSSWAGPLSFSTPIQGPVGVNCVSGGNPGIIYSDDLETSNGWTGSFGTGTTAGSWNVRTGPTGSTGTGPSGAHSGNNYFYYETSGVNPSNNSITSPLIDLSSGTDEAELSFWIHAYGATMGTLNIGVGNTSTGPFTTIFTNTGQIQTGNNDPYQNVGINLSSYLGQQIYLQLDYTSGTSFTGDIAIDLIEVSSCISCPSPSVLSASNITANSADLSWVAGGTETAWDIQYGNSGFALGSGTTVGVTTNPYSLTGLSASTTYDYYIKAICAPGDSSSWAGPFTFTTAFQCPPNAICAGPFNTGDIPSDRDFVLNGQTSTCPGTLQVVIPAGFVIDSIATMYDFTAQGGAWMSEQRSLLYLPSIGIGEPNAAAGTGGTSAGTESYARTTSFPIGLNVNGTVDIEIHAGRTWGGTGCNTQYNKIDDGTWMVIAYYGVAATCPPPSNLTVSNITANSADLSWTAGGTETAWDIQYGASGFAPGSGTTVGVTTNPYSLTGLSASSTYDYYIKAICAPGDSSSWTGPFTFTTTCAALIPPQLEDFTSGFPPNTCWDQADDGTPLTGPTSLGTSSWITDGFGNVGTTGAVKINLFTTGINDWILTPQYDLSTGGPYQIEFDFGVFQYTTNNNGSLPKTLGPDDVVEVLISRDNGSSWNVLKVYDSSYVTAAGGNHETITLNNDTGIIQFAIWASEGTQASTIQDVDVMIDNFEIVIIPCQQPTALGASNITASSADLFWTAGGNETDWEIQYGISGFVLGNGTIDSVNSNPYSLTGLSGSSTYDYYVKAICAPGDSSSWSGPFTFTTLISCPEPNGLSATTTSASSADLSWTAGGTETAWDLQYGNSGFVLGNGTIDSVSSNPYSLTGLSPSTSYDVYIKGICAPGDSSSWAGPFTFVTSCAPGTFQSISSCNTYLWNNNSYDSSGVYIDTLQANNGCDSVVTLNLTINNPVIIQDVEVSCDSVFIWNGNPLYSSGIYLDTLQAVNTCDSVVKLSLTLNYTSSSLTTQTICEGDSLKFGSGSYSIAGLYSDTLQSGIGCDSISTLDLIVTDLIVTIDTSQLNLVADISGGMGPFNYFWSNGSTSSSITPISNGLYSLFINDANGCISNTATYNFIFNTTDLISNLKEILNIYPNPNNGQFIITNSEPINEIFITDLQGKNVYTSKNLNVNNLDIEIYNLEKGMYLVNIFTKNGMNIKTVVIH